MAHVLLCPDIKASICLRKILNYFKEGDDHYRNQKVNEFCDFAKASGVESHSLFLQLIAKLGEGIPQFEDSKAETEHKIQYYVYVNNLMSELKLKDNNLLHNVVITYYEQYVRD